MLSPPPKIIIIIYMWFVILAMPFKVQENLVSLLPSPLDSAREAPNTK